MKGRFSRSGSLRAIPWRPLDLQAVDDPTYAQYSNSWESYDCGVRELIDTTDRHAGGPVLECGICLETLRYPGDDPDDPDGAGSLVGMGSRVLNGARIGRNCLIGAGALVTQNAVIPDGSMVIGSPAKVKRPLTPEEMDGIRQSAADYRREAQECRELETI